MIALIKHEYLHRMKGTNMTNNSRINKKTKNTRAFKHDKTQ
jgi:hypothetical protein